MTKTAIMFSGGFDSTLGAYEILRDTTEDVTLLYLDCGENSTRWKNIATLRAAELKTVATIAEWLSINVRPVTLVSVPLGKGYHGGWHFHRTIWAGKQAAVGAYDRFVSGFNAEYPMFPGRYDRVKADKALFNYFSGGRGVLDMPYATMTKVEMFPLFPDELFALPLSCPDPEMTDSAIKPCEKCGRCQRVALIKNGFAAGTDPVTLRVQLIEHVNTVKTLGSEWIPDRERFPKFAYWDVIEAAQ